MPNDTNNTAGSDCQERLFMPSSLRIPLIEVFHQAGDPPFICGVNGHVTTSMLDEIEKDIDENAEDMLCEGDGTYLFKATRFSGQYGDEGRCELAPYWELEMVLFSQYNGEPIRAGVDSEST
jgi:hypothetical protein